MKYMFLFLSFIACAKEIPDVEFRDYIETPFPMCECVDDIKTVYRKQVEYPDSTTQYFYSDANGLLNFNTHYGNPSPKIYDFNGTGIVDTEDLISFLSGYGQIPPTIDLCDIQVNYLNSHGWPSEYPDSYFCIVHPTAIDENFDISYCPVNTFWVELVYIDSTIKLWLH